MTFPSKSIVALVACSSYKEPELGDAMRRGLELVGGTGRFARKNEKVLLKPNILFWEDYHKGSVTHPSFIAAAGKIFCETGAEVWFGDSPAFGSTRQSMFWTGYDTKEIPLKLKEFSRGREVFFERGIQNKKFTIADPVLEANGVISLPKLKTHGLTRFTGCVKNQFGCVPGVLKGEFHAKLPNVGDFCRMLVDLNNLVNPRLYIMDAVVAMEGNGPRRGVPRPLNLILLSTDPIALDATACRLIGLDPEFVPTIPLGHAGGAGVYASDSIELAGDPFERFYTPDFKVERSPARLSNDNFIRRFFSRNLVRRPVIDTSKCVRCGVCVGMCPVDPKALEWENGDTSRPPVYRYRRCISCYCCQETCPEGAITLTRPWLSRIIHPERPNRS